MNRHLDKDVSASIVSKSFAAKGKADLEELDSDSIYDVNDEMEPQAIAPVHSTRELKNGALEYTFRHASVTRIELHR